MSKRIMVVDDKGDLLRLMRIILEEESYQVSILQQGEVAFTKIKEELPDLVILDVKLAGISGLDVLEALKEDPATADTPVIMYTAAIREAETLIHLTTADPFRYYNVSLLRKPFEVEQLLNMISQTMGLTSL